MKNIEIAILFLFFLFQGYCQSSDIRRTYVWHFGNGNTIDFSSGSPQLLGGSKIFSHEGVASISDTCGNLLFYTNGDTIWNKNNQIMPNGLSILGPENYMSSTQGCLIVPQPENDSIYFVFTNDEAENYGQNGHRFSIVNMNLDGGLGDVVEKNNLLYPTSMEKLGATYHQNGTDIWVVSREVVLGNTDDDSYVSYLVSSSGVSNQPVYSYTGGKSGGTLGYLRFNHDGSRMAAAMNASFAHYIDTIDIYDFDNDQGIVLPEALKLTADTGSVYGLCFSPDNSKLYASFFRWDKQYSKVVQYDLTSGDQQTIQSSLTVLGEGNDIIFGAIQIRPDGKLFIGKANYYNSLSDSLSVVNEPNQLGVLCDFQRDGFFLDNLKMSGNIGLPNFMDSYLYYPFKEICDVASIEESKLSKKRKLIKVVDLMGRETEEKPNTILLYIYDDGTSEKRYRVE